jgi:hypothetical protein
MPVYGIDPQSTIKRVSELERDPGAGEHEKQTEKIRRAAGNQPHKEQEDTWCGSKNDDPQKNEKEAKQPADEKPDELQPLEPVALDYKA